MGTGQLLFSSSLREKDKILPRCILCGGVWNGFFHGNSKEVDVPCRFGCLGQGWCVFWDCPSPLWSGLGRSLSLQLLLACNRSSWSRCLVWHGWLPVLAPRRVDSAWAVRLLSLTLLKPVWRLPWATYPVNPGEGWDPSWDPGDITDISQPNVWTDGKQGRCASWLFWFWCSREHGSLGFWW